MYAIAKTDRDKKRERDEPLDTRNLLSHCVDVAYAAHMLMSRSALRERLSVACGVPLADAHIKRLAVLAGLHDSGKALRGFQEKIRVAQEKGAPPAHSGHLNEFLAAVHRDDIQLAMGFPQWSGWFSDPEAALLCSIYHHGGPGEALKIDIAAASVTGNIGTHTLSDLRELYCELVALFPPGDAAKIPFTPSFQHLYAGVVMLADWIGSSLPVLGPDVRPDAVADVLRSIQWSDWHSGADYDALLEGRPPIGAQTVVSQIPPDAGLVIVEAPTGTGKTEAAVMHCLRLVETGRVDGMYFAVPLRSAAKELHQRIGRLSSYHPQLQGRIVRALPGQLDSDPWQGEVSWALGCTKKAMAAPIAVGTLDQALLTCLANNHAWMRHAALSRSLLVIDEVHASDAYMMTIMAHLIHRHLALGGPVLCMSATLGEHARALLERRSPRSFDEARQYPYPVVSWDGHAERLQAAQRQYRLVMASDGRSVAEQEVGAGKSVLWIHATVSSAIATYEWARARGIPALLHHSRFADRDRMHLDAEILGVIGKDGRRGPILICATQTAEQSLDIDADVLITSPCPGDVLLQRLGRLYRHRPGHVPTAYVLEPGNIEAVLARASGGRKTKLPADAEWSYVYSPLSVFETIAWVRAHPTLDIQDDSRDLVERSSDPLHLESVAKALAAADRDERWMQIWKSEYGAAISGVQQGRSGLIDWGKPYCDTVPGRALPTRLGDIPLTLKLFQPILSPLGAWDIESISIPYRWLLAHIASLQKKDCLEVSSIGQGAYQLMLKGPGNLSTVFEYSELGLRKL